MAQIKSKDVVVGATYEAKVSGNLVKVRVTGTVVRTRVLGEGIRQTTHYLVTNLATGKHLELRSAARLRPLPQVAHYFLDANGETREITRPEAVDTVNQCIGVGTWAQNLVQMRGEGLLIPGIGRLRIRAGAIPNSL